MPPFLYPEGRAWTGRHCRTRRLDFAQTGRLKEAVGKGNWVKKKLKGDGTAGWDDRDHESKATRLKGGLEEGAGLVGQCVGEGSWDSARKRLSGLRVYYGACCQKMSLTGLEKGRRGSG